MTSTEKRAADNALPIRSEALAIQCFSKAKSMCVLMCCGPAMFAIAIHKTVLELVDLNLTFQYWYMDEGVRCGPASDVMRDMAHLEAKFGPARLQINQQKCKVFCDDDVELPPELLALPGVSLSSGGSTFLGVPVGSAAFVRHFTEESLSPNWRT